MIMYTNSRFSFRHVNSLLCTFYYVIYKNNRTENPYNSLNLHGQASSHNEIDHNFKTSPFYTDKKP